MRPRRHPRSVVPKADRTYRGRVYRSGFEAGMARDLDQRGRSVDYEAETLWYTTPHFTRVDWRFTSLSGKHILVESKGYFPATDRTKVLRIIESNPDLDYRMVLQHATKADVAWCRKHNIKWAKGTIPDAWFGE